MTFLFNLDQTKKFGTFFPITPPYTYTCCITNWDHHINVKGGDVVTTCVVHPWHTWDQEQQQKFMLVGNEVGNVGGIVLIFCIAITCYILSFEQWGYSTIPM